MGGELTFKFLGGVVISIFAGVVLNLGSLIQKKAVNNIITEKRVKKASINIESEVGTVSTFTPSYEDPTEKPEIGLKDLIFSKLWMFGFILQAVVGAGVFIVAQDMIGPSLTPALGSIGLVVLVFASCIVNEKLTWDEYIGLVVMIGAVFLLAFSDMVIDLTDTDFLKKKFMIRVAIYTGGVILLCVFLQSVVLAAGQVRRPSPCDVGRVIGSPAKLLDRALHVTDQRNFPQRSRKHHVRAPQRGPGSFVFLCEFGFRHRCKFTNGLRTTTCLPCW